MSNTMKWAWGKFKDLLTAVIMVAAVTFAIGVCAGTMTLGYRLISGLIR